MSRATDLRWISATVLAASAAILLSALGSQYIGGLRPCVLCIYQRWPYVLTIAAGAAAAWLAWRGKGLGARSLLLLCGTAFLVGAGIAAFHIGVEQHWWAGTSSCGDEGAPIAGSVEELRRRLLAQPVVRCDEVQWSLLGLSMAGWNLLLSLGLAGLSLFGAAAARDVSDAR